MTHALTFLTSRTVFNRVRLKASRLRNPRYALAFVLGAALLWLILARRQPEPVASAGAVGRHRELVMAILASWAVAWTWMFGSRRVPLNFSLAEVDFLFPAPVPRRALIRLKLFHAQGRVLWSTLIWALLLSRGGSPALGLMHAAGVWALLSTLQLHRLGASFTRDAVIQHGRAGIARRWASLAVVLASGVAAVAIVISAAPALPAAHGGGTAFLDALAAALDAPLARALLAPFRLLVRAVATEDARAWVRAAGPALAILAAHFIWVMHADTSFEESAADAARRRADRLQVRGTASAAPGRAVADPVFRLAPGGTPSFAIVWKNLIAVARADLAKRLAIGFALGMAALAVLSVQRIGRIAPVIGALAATWAIFSVLVGPQWVRNDLRTDLHRLELLRSFPLSGAEIVAAEAAASAGVLTVLQLMLAAVTWCAFLGDPASSFDPAMRLAFLVGAAVVLPAINYLGLLLLNGGALLYPAWVRIGPGRAAGVEGLGQNVLSMVAYGVALLVALSPAVTGGGVVWWALRAPLASWAWLPAGALGLIVIALECRLLVPLLGRVLERIDIPSAGIDSA
jgi:hypothetical protein